MQWSVIHCDGETCQKVDETEVAWYHLAVPAEPDEVTPADADDGVELVAASLVDDDTGPDVWPVAGAKLDS